MDEQRLAEVCGRVQPIVKRIVKWNYSRWPVPGTSHEDITQEILVTLISYMRKMDTGGDTSDIKNIEAYATRAACNGFYTQLRKSRFVGLFDSYDSEDVPALEHLRSKTLAPEDRVIYREALERAWSKIWELPPAHFGIYILLQRDGYFGDDVASLVLETGLCSRAHLAAKIGIAEVKLVALLRVGRRTPALVGEYFGLLKDTVSMKRAEAERYIQGRPQRAGRTALGNGSSKAVRNLNTLRT